MSKLRTVAAVAAASALAATSGTAGAAVRVASGDACVQSGTGTIYTLHVSTPTDSQQFGFAFEAPGTTITNVVIPGTNGSFSTQKLPANTSGSWISDTPLTGAPVVTVTTSGAPKGPLTIVPAGASQVFLDPVACKLGGAVAPAHVSFSVAPKVAYSSSAGGWHVVVTIPTGGTVSAIELEPTVGTAGAKQVTAKALVESRRVVAQSGRKVTLTLRPTPSGQSQLRQSGSLKVAVHVVFDPQSGSSAGKTLTLTLKK
jgi:hypothetical protein